MSPYCNFFYSIFEKWGLNKKMYKNYDIKSAWKKDDFIDNSWITYLSDNQREELYKAALSLPDNESDWLKLKKEDIKIPLLQSLLDESNLELDSGRGFVLLKNLGEFEQDESLAYRINWVLALCLGDVIAQNANGEVIGPVKAIVNATDNGADTRGYVSNAELRFHCDGGDVASLLCVRQAPKGGLSTIVSLPTIHNIMLSECPEHLDTMYKGFKLYMRKEGDLESSVVGPIPIFIPQEDDLLSFINIRLMELPFETQGIPMPKNQRLALDAFESIAERADTKFEFKLQSGDMLLCHNFRCMHKRSSFIDHEDPKKCRLMLRLWYNLRNGKVEKMTGSSDRPGYFDKAPYVIRHS